MIHGLRVLALVPARGGSKGIKNKNLVDLCGKPLIAYTIEAAKKSRYIDDVVITTDSDIIAEVGRGYGARVPFIRPAELAQDDSTTLAAVLHALNELRKQGAIFEVVILLQPTSPLRTTGDIDAAMEAFAEQGFSPLASVNAVSDHPLLIRRIENGRLVKLLPQNSTCRRQDMPKYYRVNGSIYINLVQDVTNSTSFNDNSIPFIMEAIHSVDIDDRIDLELASLYLQQGGLCS